MKRATMSSSWSATILTLFPEMFPGPLGISLLGKALEKNLWSLEVRDIRDHGLGKHRSVDDTPAGGGPGMVMRADVAAAAIDAVEHAGRPLIYLSPRGPRLDQDRVRKLADGPGAILLCGRFEGLDQRVIDAGCGSGILALSAALLGYRDVAGFDNDLEAVRVSEENAALNGLEGKVQFRLGDLVTGFADGPGDVVFANILANVLIQYARELTAAVAPGGTLILSGILAVEVAQVQAAFAAVVPSWRQESRVMGEWSDVLLVRP